MLGNLLSLINQEGSLELGEACIYALIGYAIVFLGIVLIIVIIWLIGLIMRKTNNLAFLSNIKFKRKKKEKEVAEAITTADGDDIPEEVKVAIITAVMAYCSQENPKCEFKVKRIKRI
ncbi:MAG: hypothetical protein HDQ88_09140 [Clostridia bacterium]|nr:hypothetical protein [Clostridia bacterium]